MMSLIFMVLTCPHTSALEIDEKLTTRFLKISNSNRTVLINRGLEDGLVVGDHAKFFLTTGVIARGVVVKASPTRSIWSVYRVVNRDKLYKDLAVNIKITNPVEITEDPTKSLYATSAQTNVQVARGDTSKLSMGASELSEDQAELASVGDVSTVSSFMGAPTIDRTRSWEIYGLVNFSSGSGVTNEEDGQEFTGNGVAMDFSIGIEKYFSKSRGFLQQLSVFALVHSGSRTMTSLNGQSIEESVFEYGGGLHYHFLSSPFALSRFIPFVGASFGIGSVSNQTKFVGNNTANEDGPVSDGSNSFLSFGGGMKYYTQSGIGFRALIDLYTRNETYVFEEDGKEDTEVTRAVSGPRIQLGLAYRW